MSDADTGSDRPAGQSAASQRADTGVPTGADAKFDEIYRREWPWRQHQLPGTEDRHGPIASRLAPVDAESQDMRTRYWEEVSQSLGSIAREELSGPNRINYDVYRLQIETLTARQRFHKYEMPLDSDTMFWTEFARTARRPFKTTADYQSWIAQMRAIPDYFQQQIEQMRAGLRRGFTPPRVTLIGRDQSILNVAESATEETFFFVPFRQMLPSIAKPEAEQLQRQAAEVIRDLVQPAYADVLAFVREEYIPNTRSTLAARDLPDGEAYYQSLIHEFTTLDLSPQQIHDTGLTEIAQLDEQMLAVMGEIGYAGSLGEFLQYLREDPQFYARTPEQLLHQAAWIAKVFDGKAGQFFGHLPRARFALRPVPDDLAPFYTSGRGGPDAYLLNTYDLAHRPLYHLTALTLHESAPGHSFQMALSLEETSLPDFRGQSYISAFGEGWALYCEWLGQEMGMYDTGYDRFGMLSYQSWRAARLVVDTGIHALGWTREQALNYLRDHTALPQHEIETEVDRYISNPGQALAYYLGQMVVREVRATAQLRLAANFNLRAFHDTVLQLGSVPLSVLRRRIDQFIEDGGTGPYPGEE